jgi:hypothetical protein
LFFFFKKKERGIMFQKNLPLEKKMAARQTINSAKWQGNGAEHLHHDFCP